VYVNIQLRKTITLPALVIALAAALILAGCDGAYNEEKDGYKFKFKVDNNTSLNGGTPKPITKVEFINGNTRNDEVLSWSTATIEPGGERSMQYTVMGFTIERTSSTRIFGVQVTFDDETKAFNWSYAGHESKILVAVGHPTIHNQSGMSFSYGNW
jgi:hypothetical protein